MVLGVVHGWRRDRRLSVISILVLLNIALFWLAIPYRTQQRFIFHALGLAVVPLAMMLDRSRWLRVGFATLIALHIFTGQDWPFGVFGQAPPWDFSPLVSHSTDGLINLSSSPIMLWARGIGSLLIALTWAWANWRPSPQRIATGLISSIALVAVLIGLNVGRASAPFPIFPAFRDYYLGWLDLEGRSGPGGLRIAYSGTNIPYYLMGRDFRNEIRYINTDAHRDWLLHDYHRAAIARGVPNWPYPRPGWDRTNPNYEAWLANLRAAGIQVLVVARANPEEGPHNIYDSQGFPIERFWAETHPTHFSPLYGVTENDPLFRSYRILNPRK